jgi:HAD superfamily hydrolase (TIGR01549 family)
MKIYNKHLFVNTPKAVLIDLDNTLYNYDLAHSEAMRALEKKFFDTLKVPAKLFYFYYSKSREKIHKSLKNTASSHSRLLYIQNMIEYMGLGSSISIVSNFEQTYWNNFLLNIELFDGAEDFLNDLRMLSIPIVLITDLSSHIQFRKLISIGLDAYFDYIVTSEEAGAEKPSELPFRIALQKLNIKEGKDLWMIGDSLDLDIKGSKKAIKATTLLKKNKKFSRDSDVRYMDASFYGYKDLRNLLSKLESNNEK